MPKRIMKGIFTFLLLGFTVLANVDEGVLVLIVDSGVDYTHERLQPYMLADLAELHGQPGTDDSNSGYADDIYGWNFIDNSPVQVDLSLTPKDLGTILRFLDRLGRFQTGGRKALSLSEYASLRLRALNPFFMNRVNFVGGWAHGTHCAGIAALDSENIRIKGITHIPAGDGAGLNYENYVQRLRTMLRHNVARRSRSQDPLDELYESFDAMAYEAIEEIRPEADYIAALNPRVINCSFGSENSHLLHLFREIMTEELGISDPSPEQVQDMVNLFVTRVFLPRDRVFFEQVPDSLIVIAAGNSAEDNDHIAVSPNNVQIENKLVVAATFDDIMLAPFSCYGATQVDIAVPGVNIYSTYPANRMGYMSGTSMAAPLAARYAAEVFAAAPSLNGVQVRQILMETVDMKSWLIGKVKSGGVINSRRAVKAAELFAQGSSLNQSIAMSRRLIPDNEPSRTPIPVFETEEEIAIYNSAIF